MRCALARLRSGAVSWIAGATEGLAFAPQRHHEILRPLRPRILPPVLLVGVDAYHAPCRDARDLAYDGHIQQSRWQHDALFVHVVMRGVRRLPRPEFGDVYVHRKSGVVLAVEHVARPVLPVDLDRKSTRLNS